HQMPIPQTAAAGFAAPFYQNVVLACPVEEGVRTFRADSVKASPFGCSVPDWGIPVTFLGVRDSRLFKSERVDAYPINFSEILRQHDPTLGRDFLKKEFAAFQRKRESAIFLLTAPPGLGKTAFVAQWANDDCDLVHFFYRVTAGVTDPDECVKSLYHGLLARHGDLDENPTHDPTELRRRLEIRLDKISARCTRSGRKEVLLLDALDEARPAARTT